MHGTRKILHATCTETPCCWWTAAWRVIPDVQMSSSPFLHLDLITFFRNVAIQSPNHTVSHPRRTESLLISFSVNLRSFPQQIVICLQKCQFAANAVWPRRFGTCKAPSDLSYWISGSSLKIETQTAGAEINVRSWCGYEHRYQNRC